MKGFIKARDHVDILALVSSMLVQGLAAFAVWVEAMWLNFLRARPVDDHSDRRRSDEELFLTFNHV